MISRNLARRLERLETRLPPVRVSITIQFVSAEGQVTRLET